MMKETTGGITAPRGFRAAGIHCGVKKTKKDLCLLVSDRPAAGAAVLTTNRVQAAPILVVREQLAAGRPMRAVVVNSGNANACTGERGLRDAWAMADAAGEALGIDRMQVLVSSTGVIGQFLPIEKITAGIASAAGALAPDGGGDAAEAILTTDTFTKQYAVCYDAGGTTITLGGMAKGSGMIAPNMATMLAFITTDAAIEAGILRTALRQAADRSFNRISVDGDTSTNDMVAVLANGASGTSSITSDKDPAYAPFYAALESVLIALSKMIVVDGEGATKFVEIQVRGARSEDEAAQAARAIANSNLVKTAIHGEDANWGRILAAVGYSGIDFDPALSEISFDDVPILRKNYAIDFSEEDAKRVLQKKEIRITIDLHQGNASAFFWTCDLSKEYVAINANYRT
jgi:glutamate N-acetyltransferase/amino-acid N-acetyltransferase